MITRLIDIGIRQYWCWVGPRYKHERIWGEYLWMWVALFVSILVYVPLVLWNMGHIWIEDERWWVIGWVWRPGGRVGAGRRERPGASSLQMLACVLFLSG